MKKYRKAPARVDVSPYSSSFATPGTGEKLAKSPQKWGVDSHTKNVLQNGVLRPMQHSANWAQQIAGIHAVANRFVAGAGILAVAQNCTFFDIFPRVSS